MEEEDDDEAMDGDDVMMEVQGGRCKVEDCGKLKPHGKKPPKIRTNTALAGWRGEDNKTSRIPGYGTVPYTRRPAWYGYF